jgi:predicted transcriptional regulator
MSRTVTLQLPEDLYLRLQQAAQATRQSLEDIFLRAINVGSPPDWEDVPAEFQADIAALDRLDDTSLWRVARRKKTETAMSDYQQLLDKNADGTISKEESRRLNGLRAEFDRYMLSKAHAVALLRWRGHSIPPADKL